MMMTLHYEAAQLRRPGYNTALLPEVRCSINVNTQTIGKHRFRLAFAEHICEQLAQGLAAPRLHVEGDVLTGLRIWCGETGGFAPIQGKSQKAWNITLPCRRVKAREKFAPVAELKYYWERGEHGPTLVIPRLPDSVIPEDILAKLPRRNIEPETAAARPTFADRARLAAESAFKPPQPQPQPQPAMPKLALAASRLSNLARAEHEIAHRDDPVPVPEVHDPLPAPVTDLKAAVDLVNELRDQLGDSVCLFVSGDGRLAARRRVVTYIDL